MAVKEWTVSGPRFSASECRHPRHRYQITPTTSFGVTSPRVPSRFQQNPRGMNRTISRFPFQDWLGIAGQGQSREVIGHESVR